MRRLTSRALWWLAATVAALGLAAGVNGSATAQGPKRPAAEQEPPAAGGAHHHGAHQHGGADHKHDDHAHDEESAHVHAPVPAEYRAAHLPSAAWTNQPLIARGKEIYASRCSVCHGDQGDGKGPATGGLPLKPPSFLDVRMVNEMPGNYWFWRVSEGGLVEPFKSMGSVMPAWKTELSVEDRWAVIAYTHTLSGHSGPHVTSEHPEMLMASHAGHGSDDEPRSATPATGPPTAAPRGSHRH